MADLAWRVLADRSGHSAGGEDGATADGVREAFGHQAEACDQLGSPFMGVLCRLTGTKLSPRTEIGRLVLEWPGDPSPSGQSVPLRFCGALHALVLSGQDDALAAAYPPSQTDPDQLWAAVEQALHTHAGFIRAWMGSAPQTNEVRRSSALYAGLCVIAERMQLPLHLMELGASAGLNLICDAYAYRFGAAEAGRDDAPLLLAPEWRGQPMQPARLAVGARQGCDLNPLDVGDAQDRLRLTAYLWADQADRLARTNTAIAIARSEDFPFDIARQDAAGWLASRLRQPGNGRCRVVMHSIAWQYFPAEAQARCRQTIEEAGNAATASAPLAWLSMEADGGAEGAALTLRMWPGDVQLDLGRADFHGRWIDWHLRQTGGA